MSTQQHDQAETLLVFTSPDHRTLAQTLEHQALARAWRFEWHDANQAHPESVFASLTARGQRASMVVFASGHWQAGSALDTPASVWQEAWEQQCLNGFKVGQAAIQSMQAGRTGTLIYLGHDSGYTDTQPARRTAPPAFSASHAASSAGLRALSQSMARAFGPRHVHVAHMILGETPPFHQAASLNVAEACWMLHEQRPSAWTHELDLRPNTPHD